MKGLAENTDNSILRRLFRRGEVSYTISDLSKAVVFAMEHGAEKKRALTYGLITEELSVMLTEHGFSDGRSHHINARLVAKDEDLIVRI